MIHLQVGGALETAHAERASELAAELAHHFAQGGDLPRAIHHRRSAAETAARRFSFIEAEMHLQQALGLLTTLPATPQRDRDELALQTMVATVRQVTRGYAAPEVSTAFGRALELSHDARDTTAFPVLNGIWTFYAVTGELDRALDLAQRNLEIAEASGDRLMRLVAHQGLWTTHFFRGELAAALRHLDAGEPLYDPDAHRGAALRYGTDPKTAALSYRALVLWATGAVERSVTLAHEAIDQARSLGHPLSLGRAMVFAAWLRHCRREPDACRGEADAALAYCEAQGLPFWVPHALGMRGWALTVAGDLQAGTADLERAFSVWKAIGATCGRTPNDRTLAEAYLRSGRLIEARAQLEHANALIARGERFHEPEIRLLEAELVLAEAGGLDQAAPEARALADALVDVAIDCATRQGARTLELRAVTILGRRAKRGAKSRQVRARLAGLLTSFNEGFDTPDLVDARRLVEQSSHPDDVR
jgi:tetratricopeptide (TPR) repeat protein